jgi:hypothetical protein
MSARPQEDGFFEAKIDRTLGRICRLLKLRNWKSAEVINLSDQREALSEVFLIGNNNGDFESAKFGPWPINPQKIR